MKEITRRGFLKRSAGLPAGFAAALAAAGPFGCGSLEPFGGKPGSRMRFGFVT